MREFEVDSAVLKWEAALEDLQQAQARLADVMQRYGVGEADYPYELVAAVLRLRDVHDRRYDAAAIALHAARTLAEAAQSRYVEYSAPPAAEPMGGKWRAPLAARPSGASASATVQ